jgi:PGF-pre-PGF domain-containing protein
VIESDETNNEFGKTINVKLLIPDLTIKSLSWSPETPKTGENITFTATVRNIGSGDSPTSNLKYNINGNNEAHSDILTVPALAAGKTAQSTFSWTPGNEGNIEVTATVDPDAVIPESDETNNQLKITAAVTGESTSTGGGEGENSNSGSGESGSGSGESSSSSGESSSGSSQSSSGSSKSSSGSGGMGSSFSKEPAKNVAAKELATRNVANGNHIIFDFSRNSTCVLYIEYDAERTFLKTTTTVEELKDKSIFVPESPSGRIYKYMNIWVGDRGGGLPTSFENGMVGFKVEKAWIKDNGVNESLVILQWYNKSWKPLYTEKVGEDNNYDYFKSKTPGFSFFAITENTGEVSKSGVQIGAKLPNTPGRLESIGKGDKSISGNKNKAQEVREGAKTLMALSLPIFLIFVGYLVVKKKI